MQAPTAQKLTRRSSIVVRQNLKVALTQNKDVERLIPKTEKALLADKTAIFDAHFPQQQTQINASNLESPAGGSNKRLGRRSSVAITQNLKDLTHAKFGAKRNPASEPRSNTSHSLEWHPEELKKRDFIDHLRSEFMVDNTHDGHELYTNQNILKRESLKFEKRIQFTLKRLWKLVDADHSGQIDKGEYFELHKRLLKALVDGAVTVEEELELAQEDWLNDTTGVDDIHTMNRQQFVNAFFRMVDVWTDNICVDEYATFLEDAFDRIAENDGNGNFRYKNVNEVHFRGRRSSVIVQNGKLLALQLDNLMQEKTPGKSSLEVKPKLTKKMSALPLVSKRASLPLEGSESSWWNRLHKKKEWWTKVKSTVDVGMYKIDTEDEKIPVETKDTYETLTVDPEQNMHIRRVQNGDVLYEAVFKMSDVKFSESKQTQSTGVVYAQTVGENGSRGEDIYLATVSRSNWWKFYQSIYSPDNSMSNSGYWFLTAMQQTQYETPISNGSDSWGVSGTDAFNLKSCSICSFAPKLCKGDKYDTSREYDPLNEFLSVKNSVSAYMTKQHASPNMKMKKSRSQGGGIHRGSPSLALFNQDTKKKKKKKRGDKNWLEISGEGFGLGGQRLSRNRSSPGTFGQTLPPITSQNAGNRGNSNSTNDVGKYRRRGLTL